MIKWMGGMGLVAVVICVGLCDTVEAGHHRRARRAANQNCAPVQQVCCGASHGMQQQYSNIGCGNQQMQNYGTGNYGSNQFGNTGAYSNASAYGNVGLYGGQSNFNGQLPGSAVGNTTYLGR